MGTSLRREQAVVLARRLHRLPCRRRVNETRHRLKSTVARHDTEISATQVKRGVPRAPDRPTKSDLAVVRLDAADEAKLITRKLALGLIDHGIDRFMAFVGAVRVII